MIKSAMWLKTNEDTFYFYFKCHITLSYLCFHISRTHLQWFLLSDHIGSSTPERPWPYLLLLWTKYPDPQWPMALKVMTVPPSFLCGPSEKGVFVCECGAEHRKTSRQPWRAHSNLFSHSWCLSTVRQEGVLSNCLKPHIVMWTKRVY